ncbi:MAG: hypothetical protein RL701_7514 [Pseudomonadota bacterium]
MVTVEQRDQVLLLHGRDQDIRTDACWSRNPAMKRSIASYTNGTWLTRCRTVDNDPRAEQGTYTLKLQDAETLLYKDVSRYDWTLNESKCVATFTTTQTLTRSAAAASEAAAAASTGTGTRTSKPTAAAPTRGEPANTSSAAAECTPGAAARLSVRPKKAEIELGQRVCFKVRVSDAADCALPTTDVVWLLGHANGVRGTFVSGCFTAAESAAEGEGEFRITAKRGGLQTEATVVVRRVDMSALIARRMEGTGLDGTDDSDNEAVAITPKAVARIEPHVAPPSAQTKGGGSLSWGLGIAAIALLGLGVWVRRKQPQPVAAISSTTPPPLASQASNGSSRPPGGPPTTPPPIPPAALRAGGASGPSSARGASGSPNAHSALDAPSSNGVSSLPTAHSTSDLPNAHSALDAPKAKADPAAKNPDEPWICPTCRIGYPAHQATCPKDGTLLVPYAQFSEQHKRVELKPVKRCPKCGKTYPAGDSFCGDDGANLVSLQ